MPLIQIKRYDNNTLIYEGHHETAKQCIEQAITENITLSHADLRYANLQGANLDGAAMPHAQLDHVNLSGANISECDLSHASLKAAHLPDSCLCESDLTHCRFDGASFGATDITAAILDYAAFSTPSALSLDFQGARSMIDCTYMINERPIPFTRPPLNINGMDWPIALLDHHMLIGNQCKTYAEWFTPRNDNHNPDIQDGAAYIERFVQMHRKMLLSLAYTHTRSISAACNSALRSMA